MTRDEFCKFVATIVMAVVGLSHTYNTKVGDDFVRGVSGKYLIPSNITSLLNH
jgi:ATP-binding cassette subfamily G (WHITE) protein 2 (PDR)